MKLEEGLITVLDRFFYDFSLDNICNPNLDMRQGRQVINFLEEEVEIPLENFLKKI